MPNHQQRLIASFFAFPAKKHIPFYSQTAALILVFRVEKKKPHPPAAVRVL